MGLDQYLITVTDSGKYVVEDNGVYVTLKEGVKSPPYRKEWYGRKCEHIHDFFKVWVKEESGLDFYAYSDILITPKLVERFEEYFAESLASTQDEWEVESVKHLLSAMKEALEDPDILSFYASDC